MKKRENKRNLVLVLLLLVVATVSVGYALLSTSLNISGTSVVKASDFDVHFYNIRNTSPSSSDVIVTSAPAITELTTTPSDASDDKHITFNISFAKPTDSYEFDVDVVNGGDLYAKCKDIETTIPSELADYIQVTYTGLSDTQGSETVLSKSGVTGDSTTMHVTVSMKDVNALPSTDVSGTVSIGIDFEQTNPTA